MDAIEKAIPTTHDVVSQPRDAHGHWLPMAKPDEPKEERDGKGDDDEGGVRTPAPSMSPPAKDAKFRFGEPVDRVFLSIDGGEPQYLASGAEWKVIKRWAAKLNLKRYGQLVQLIEHGVHERIDIVMSQLRRAVRGIKELPKPLARFVALLRRGGKFVTLNNGQASTGKSLSVHKSGQYDESKHRRGQPGNAGQFGSGGGSGQQQLPGRGGSPGIVGQHGGPREQTGTGAGQPQQGAGEQMRGMYDNALKADFSYEALSAKIQELGKLSLPKLKEAGVKAGVPESVFHGSKAQVLRHLEEWVVGRRRFHQTFNAPSAGANDSLRQ